MLFDPVVLAHKARFPIAVLFDPVVLENKARCPIAVLLDPDVLARKALAPIAVLWVPVALTHKAKGPAEKLHPPVAEELKAVVEPIEIFVETFPPPVLISKLLIEPVTPNDPVIKADPVYGNVAPPPPLPVLTVMGNVVPLSLVNVIVFEDTDAVTIAFGVKDAVEAKLELTAFKT